MEVDFVLQRDSLRKLGQPFIGNPATVAVCSPVWPASGCVVKEAFVDRPACHAHAPQCFYSLPLCREAVPETMKALKNQHIRRQRSLSASLELNRQLLFSRRGGMVGGVSFPLALIFECFGPLIELLCYVVMTALWLSGAISLQAFGSFMLAAIGMGMLLSVSGLVRDEISLRTYPRLGSVLKLFAVTLLENSGYRQLTAFWRLLGQQRWILRNEAK